MEQITSRKISLELHPCKTITFKLNAEACYKLAFILFYIFRDIAKEYNFSEIESVLLHTKADSKLDVTFEKKDNRQDIVIWKCQLDQNQEEIIMGFANKFHAVVISTWPCL